MSPRSLIPSGKTFFDPPNSKQVMAFFMSRFHCQTEERNWLRTTDLSFRIYLARHFWQTVHRNRHFEPFRRNLLPPLQWIELQKDLSQQHLQPMPIPDELHADKVVAVQQVQHFSNANLSGNCLKGLETTYILCRLEGWVDACSNNSWAGYHPSGEISVCRQQHMAG